ncbi:MAG: DUF2252 family protein [Planctomycetes bacterium]|nr:DUF2252 family protein [Planctomycetota bacterium]
METLLAASRGRLPELLPIKLGRMAASPFGFFRGAAPVMAGDLCALPITWLEVQLCGDAHVRNLGAYAAPECGAGLEMAPRPAAPAPKAGLASSGFGRRRQLSYRRS